MAKYCELCGKKDTFFTEDPFNLDDGKILCYKCASPVANNLNALYYASNRDIFEKIKSEILAVCREKYNSEITKCIIKKIDTRELRISELEATIKQKEVEDKKQEYIANYMVTTGCTFESFTIKKYIGIVSGQVVLGTGFLSEYSASFADFFGVESNEFEDKLGQAKNAAMKKMIEKSIEKGGNALIGVDFDYITFRSNMIGVVANGTSVNVEKNS